MAGGRAVSELCGEDAKHDLQLQLKWHHLNLGPYSFTVVGRKSVRVLTKLNQGRNPVHQSKFLKLKSVCPWMSGAGQCQSCEIKGLKKAK